jgi:hypothetical protein
MSLAAMWAATERYRAEMGLIEGSKTMSEIELRRDDICMPRHIEYNLKLKLTKKHAEELAASKQHRSILQLIGDDKSSLSSKLTAVATIAKWIEEKTS